MKTFTLIGPLHRGLGTNVVRHVKANSVEEVMEKHFVTLRERNDRFIGKYTIVLEGRAKPKYVFGERHEDRSVPNRS